MKLYVNVVAKEVEMEGTPGEMQTMLNIVVERFREFAPHINKNKHVDAQDFPTFDSFLKKLMEDK